MIVMLKIAYLSIVVAVLIRNTDAAKSAAPSKTAPAYNLYRQVYSAPATKPAANPELANLKASLAADSTKPKYDWCPRGRPCSLFIEKNMEEANYVIQLMLAAPDYDSFIYLCSYLSGEVNEYIFVYAYTYALIYRPDTQGIIIPPIEEVDPCPYISAPTIKYAEELMNSTDTTVTPGPIFVDYQYENGTDSCTAYFREDIGINSVHWNWHVVNNANSAKERQGERFFYYHRQILARYDCARFTCGLPRVTPLPDFYKPIPESYYPNLLTGLSGNYYQGRGPNLVLQDVTDSGLRISEQDLNYQKLVNASVFRTYRASNGTYVALTSTNIMSALTEANNASPNRGFYGSVHNILHVVLARITTANISGGESGVMAYPNTAMRDPVFYRWHKNIDNIIENYASKNPQYTAVDLQLANFEILSAYVEGASGINILRTFFETRTVDISNGVDLSGTRRILVRVKHLQHENFTHNIVVENKATIARNITFRIFLAPNVDHLKKPLPFSEQRTLAMTLDIFTILVNPGNQTIKRRDEDSSVTLPTQLSFEQLQKEDVNAETTNNSNQVPSRCMCGWPDTHLIPMGTVDGTKYCYFVMATDGADYEEPTSDYCTSAPVYCGLRNAPYPDKRPMGYPFDREAPSSVTTFTQFAAYPNMKCEDITIKHG